jgi:Gram-negative bacterial TonB protein C-terminal
MISLPPRVRCLPLSFLAVSCVTAHATRVTPAPVSETPADGSSRPVTQYGNAAPPRTGGTSCGFPQHTHAAFGWARLRVYVNPDGSPGQVQILEASEPVFGDQARECARGRRYKPAANDAGVPVGAYTPTVNVRFSR